MNGQQQLVGAGGTALLLLNFWGGKDRHVVAKGMFDSGAGDTDRRAAHAMLMRYGAALLFVGVATIFAGVSSQAGNAMAAIVAGLFLVWAVNKYGKASASAGESSGLHRPA